MALASDISCTITLTNGSAAFTTTNASMVTRGTSVDDLVLIPSKNAFGIIASITGENAGTLSEAWTGTTGTFACRIRAQNDGIKVSAQARNLLAALNSLAQPASEGMSNLGLAASVASSALTIRLKQANGTSDPAADSAVVVSMQDATASNGAFNQRSATGPLSAVVPSGATMGQANAVAAKIYVYLLDNAGSLELAVSGTDYGETGYVTTVALTAASDDAASMFSTVARAGVPFRKVAVLTNTQATAGTWLTVPSVIQLAPFGAPTSAGAGVPAGSETMSNLGLAAAVASSALTVKLKQADGATDPSASSPVIVSLPATSAAVGSFSQRSVSAALSLVVPSGATLGQINATAENVYVYLIDNAGALELAVSGADYGEVGYATTTAISASASSATVMYSATARAGKPFRKIGVVTNTQAAAGTWATAPSAIQLAPFQPVISEFVKTLLDDLDASTALTTLGISTFIKTLLDDADAATALATLGANNAANLIAGTLPDAQLPSRLQPNGGPAISDCNAVTDSGFYRVNASAANAPSTATLVLLHITFSATQARQIAFRHSANIMWERANVGGTWTPWYIIWSAADLIGTVSQSSGQPTGSIIERGSNANGEYVRYADGTQICWQEVDSGLGAMTARTEGSYTFQFSSSTWTFPAAFVASPAVSGSFRGNAASGTISVMAGFNVAAVAATNASTRMWTADATTLGSPTYLSRMAIGRWF